MVCGLRGQRLAQPIGRRAIVERRALLQRGIEDACAQARGALSGKRCQRVGDRIGIATPRKAAQQLDRRVRQLATSIGQRQQPGDRMLWVRLQPVACQLRRAESRISSSICGATAGPIAQANASAKFGGPLLVLFHQDAVARNIERRELGVGQPCPE